MEKLQQRKEECKEILNSQQINPMSTNQDNHTGLKSADTQTLMKEKVFEFETKYKRANKGWVDTAKRLQQVEQALSQRNKDWKEGFLRAINLLPIENNHNFNRNSIVGFLKNAIETIEKQLTTEGEGKK